MSLDRATLIRLTGASRFDLAEASSHSEGLQEAIGGGADRPYIEWDGVGALARWWEGYGQGGLSGKRDVGELLQALNDAELDAEWSGAQELAGYLARTTKEFIVHYQGLASTTPQDWVATMRLLQRTLQRGAGGFDTLQAQVGNVRRSLRRHRS